MHCVSEYPADFKKLKLDAIKFLKKKLKLSIGYSDHSLGVEAPVAAVSLGANIIEKHFTLNKKLKGPDHKMSLDQKELITMISYIRNISNALGVKNKIVSREEEKIKLLVRKSIVAKKIIKRGEKFSKKNLTTKRPGNGISPMKWKKLVGKKSKKTFKINEQIS